MPCIFNSEIIIIIKIINIPSNPSDFLMYLWNTYLSPFPETHPTFPSSNCLCLQIKLTLKKFFVDLSDHMPLSFFWDMLLSLSLIDLIFIHICCVSSVYSCIMLINIILCEYAWICLSSHCWYIFELVSGLGYY